jgi:hypothetical protein
MEIGKRSVQHLDELFDIGNILGSDNLSSNRELGRGGEILKVAADECLIGVD